MAFKPPQRGRTKQVIYYAAAPSAVVEERLRQQGRGPDSKSQQQQAPQAPQQRVVVRPASHAHFDRHVARVVLGGGPVQIQPQKGVVLLRAPTGTLLGSVQGVEGSQPPAGVAQQPGRVALVRACTAVGAAPAAGGLVRAATVMTPAPVVAARAAVVGRRAGGGSAGLVARPVLVARGPTMLLAPAVAAPPTAVSMALGKQVEAFMARLGLSAHAASAAGWVDDMGACDLNEVLENIEDLATALSLEDAERQRLLEGAQAAAAAVAAEVAKVAAALPKAVIRSPLVSAQSVPVTVAEHTKAHEALLLSLVDEARYPETEEEVEEDEDADDVDVPEGPAEAEELEASRLIEAPCDSAEATAWRLEECEKDRTPLNARQEKVRRRNRKLRWYTPPRHRWRVDEKLLRARIPSQVELKAVENARKAAEAAVRAEWGNDGEDEKKDGNGKGVKKTKKERKSDRDPMSSFAAMRKAFLKEYEWAIRKELGEHITLVPADLSEKVQTKFLNACQNRLGGLPDFGYHGTRDENIPSILEQGLRVPGEASGVKVVNGSAHGVGIYTALPGGAGLARQFCSTSNMLICGVVDPEAEKVVNPEEEETKKRDASGEQAAKARKFVGGLGGHRNHHKPVPAPKTSPFKFNSPSSWPNVNRESEDGAVRCTGAARILFQEDLVAPLFVAQGAGNIWKPGPVPVPTRAARPVNGASILNPVSPEQTAGRGQTMIQHTGEVMWLPPEASTGWNEIRVKRMYVGRERTLQRAELRAVKAGMMRTTSTSSQQ